MFKHIVAVDNTGLKDWAINEINQVTEKAVFHTTDPINEEQVIERAQGADGLLVSWRTPITAAVIDACPDLRYIGMCCSLYDEKSANVDIAHARAKGIPVLGVRDYGDEGLVEFILSELIRLYHGFGDYTYGDKQEELSDKTLGIIGFGTTGQMLASRAQVFGMKVVYTSRTRKAHLEGPNLSYLPLEDLLKKAHVVSTHVPKHTIVLNQAAFDLMDEGKILVNTSLEPTFDVDAFKAWIKKEKRYAIFDRGGLGAHAEDLSALNRVITSQKVSGFTRQAEERLSRKVVDNLLSVL